MMSVQHHHELQRVRKLSHRRLQAGEAGGQVLRDRHAVMRRLVGEEGMTTGALSGPVVGGWFFIVRHVVLHLNPNSVLEPAS